MREVFDDFVKDADVEIPKPDLSFMYEESRAKKAFRRMPRVAACFLVLFVASGSMAVWVNSESAHTLKFNMEKTFHKISSTLFSTSESDDENFEEDRITISIDSMDDIQDAVDFMPNLPIPEYIPEGFELEKLEVSKFLDGTYSVNYKFANENENTLSITSNFDTSEVSLKLISEMEEIYAGDYVIYPWEDKYTATHGISFLVDDQLIDIFGDVDQEKMIKVASQLNL